jgi:hypothetical protein
MLRKWLFVILLAGSLVNATEQQLGKRASHWHTDWLVVVSHYNESLKWLTEIPFELHIKVSAE